MLSTVISAPLSWFNKTPSGRILNRFNADMDKIDALLAWSFDTFLYLFVRFSSVVVVIIVVFPLSLVPFVCIFAAFLYYQGRYRRPKIDLARLEAMSRSPLFSHFSETLEGMSSIRAYNELHRTRTANYKLTDRYLAAIYTSFAFDRWLSSRLQLLCALFIACTTFLILVSKDLMSTSMAGFLLSYAIDIPENMFYTVRYFTQFEYHLASVERVREYSNVQDENESSVVKTKKDCCSKEWPSQGNIELRDVTLRYRRDLSPALNHVTFTVPPGTVCGIVGRTGAGKSSLVSILFRLAGGYEGEVLIDGVNILDLPLQKLRSQMSIIPQEPLIFSGTVRWNLDPGDEHSDSDIWRVLRVCGLVDDEGHEGVYPDMELGMSGSGLSKLSLGQQQLLCLGRALLRKSRIVVLDEATSSVDRKVDQKVQQIVQKHFAHSTVLIVAHRIDTVMDADQVILMADGRIVAQGPPNFLKKSNAEFSRMAELSAVQSQ
eukprot:Plantae.Rhodophyta-Hildenbrandia_rubra.ctg23494.p1 GENE.Plantae.Rhodophyta-Hildenbrandia_rubra.ctg23494~~Plantae.Rhodophyta-Hildenbrandia_rubra.ctg23494.p1  ORF type:complete len:547 (+),score=34.24 Plantae.Rhodophyta-Hildenbrandia_rubra.ctg23494:176-1642(+)